MIHCSQLQHWKKEGFVNPAVPEPVEGPFNKDLL